MNTPEKEYSESDNDSRRDAAEYGNAPHAMNSDNSGDAVGGDTYQDFRDGNGENPNFSQQSKIAKAADEKHPKSHDENNTQDKDKS